MALQVLPLGVTSLSARRPPAFKASPITLPSSADHDTYAKALWSEVSARDPRYIIGEDVEAIRLWMRAITGNSWSNNFSIDEIMRSNPWMVYNAACLILQAKYWGDLPDDQIGASAPESPAYHWPNDKSVLETRVYTWKLNYRRVSLPSNLDYLAQEKFADTPGRLWIPTLVPGLLIQKFDEVKEEWRVLEDAGMDRDFSLHFPDGHWHMRGWDFSEWASKNADWMTVLQAVGVVVIATAAIISGGAALNAGAGLMAAAGAAIQAASYVSAVESQVFLFADAIKRQDLGAALAATAGITKTALGVDLKDVPKEFYKGVQEQIGPYFSDAIGSRLSSELMDAVNQISRSGKDFKDKLDQLTLSFGADAAKTATGLAPDQLTKTIVSMGVNELGILANKVRADYEAKVKAAIRMASAQVPEYLRDWQAKGEYLAKGFGPDEARKQIVSIPGYGLKAFEAGIVSGSLEASLKEGYLDINQLTPSQKRALFLGDISLAMGFNNFPLATEFMRQAGLVWEEWQKLGRHYFPGAYFPAPKEISNVLPPEKFQSFLPPERFHK